MDNTVYIHDSGCHSFLQQLSSMFHSPLVCLTLQPTPLMYWVFPYALLVVGVFINAPASDVCVG